MNWRLKEAIGKTFGTQGDFSKAVGVSESVVSRVIKGRRELTKDEREMWNKLLTEKGIDVF